MRVLLIVCFCVLLGLLGGAVSITAQDTLPAKNANTAGVAPAPAPKASAGGFSYKGVMIGMTADDIRKKLGEPRDKTDQQDLFVFSDEESAQFIYGPDKTVRAMMLTYSGKMSGAPTPKDVFGEDVAPKPDGNIFKMVRYPKAGYWISYNKIIGDDSIVSIAMQKL